MDPTKIPPSFLTFIGEETIFFTIPSDFATNLWGYKVPYGKTVQIRDGDSLRFVRIRKRNGEPIFTDGWIMLVRENALKLKDGVLITATGPSTFTVSWFKEYVCKNSYFTAQLNTVPGMCLMPEKVWNNFYGKNYKARVYVGERFWDVKLEGWSDCCCFRDGWLKVVEEVPLKNEPSLVFTMIDLKTFELSVFDPETGTEMVFEKVDVVRGKGKCKIDADEVLVIKNENPTKPNLRSGTTVAAEKQYYDRPTKVRKVKPESSIADEVLVTKNENPTKPNLRSGTTVAAEKQYCDRPTKVRKVKPEPSIASLVLKFTGVAERRI